MLRLSPLIIGVTVVAIGTSLPELAVSAIASIKGDFGLAVGNIIGSNIINVLLVFALGVFAGNVKVGTKKTQRNVYFLTFISCLFVVMLLLKLHPLIFASVSLSLCFLFTIMEYRWGVTGRNLEDKLLLKMTKKSKVTNADYGVLVLCLILIFAGGYLVVEGVKYMALITGYSTNVLGLTVTAIATSLPEIIATVMSSRSKQAKLLLGNIMGSNVYNILLIGGISSLWMTTYQLPIVDTVFFLLSTFLFFIIIVGFKGKILPRFVGVSLFALCAVYFLSLSNL
jgi:cation:H+ antiporter